MRDLVLTGFMGTGKSTVGRILADRHGLELVDTDTCIERRTGKTIPEIFERDGEAVFRRLETEILRDLRHGSGRVIATGGGALMSEENRALISPDQPVVCLTCGSREFMERIGNGDRRPLTMGRGQAALVELYEARQDVYNSFPQFDTSGKQVEQVADEIAAATSLASFQLRFDGTRETSIVFARSAVGRLGELLQQFDLWGRSLVVTDEAVCEQKWMQDGLLPSLRVLSPPEQGREASALSSVRLTVGEEHKTLASISGIYDACMGAGLDRSSTIVGIGGGVVGDVAGFAAATYMRGIRLVLVPTTLLAQVDAAIGGKVGVDVGGVKNLVGAFHPAALVVIDPDVLVTLPNDRLADGLAEVVKIAAVFSQDLLQRVGLLEGVRDILDDFVTIRRAAELKAKVVEDDPYEHGDRARLNFGHTVGHGIEAASGYRLSHGQSISVGMVAEMWLAEHLGIIPPDLCDRIGSILARFGLPLSAPHIDPREVLRFVLHDKKAIAGRTRFAVPEAPGTGTLIEVGETDVVRAIEHAVGGRA